MVLCLKPWLVRVTGFLVLYLRHTQSTLFQPLGIPRPIHSSLHIYTQSTLFQPLGIPRSIHSSLYIYTQSTLF